MARIYLEPGDVGPTDARMVLDFLNAASSAEEIASAVELPGELDIGLRLGQRILDRRAELGEFTSLQQVADVPLIGPERFTEIVTTLSAARVPQASVPADFGSELLALRREMDALRSGAAQPTLTVRTLQPEPFLGQSVDVVARATAPGSDRPMIGATVVLSTTWGRLRGVEGVTLREGESLRLRTGVDGSARAVLVPPTEEDLSQVQQSTLETALQALDTSARTPAETRSGLESMARRYRREGEDVFRRAVDVYFRDFGGKARDPLNPTDALAAWSHFQSTLVAYLPDPELPSAVRATAVEPLWIRDWITPWLEVHEALAGGEAVLDAELIDLVRTRIDEEATGSLLGRVYGRIRDYVDDQRGVVGELVGRRVAERSLTAVLDAGLADASPAARVAIFPGAEAGTRLLETASTSVLAGIGDARIDVRRDVEPRLDTEFGDVRLSIASVETQLSSRGDEIGTLTGRLASLETTVDGKADVLRVAALESADLTRADSISALSQQLGSLTTRFDDFEIDIRDRIDVSQFTAFQDEIAGQLAGIRDTVDQRLATFQGDFDQQLATKADATRVDALEANPGVGADELGAITGRLDGMQSALDGKLDATQFTAFEADIGQQIGAVQASVGSVTTQVAGFDTRLDGMQGALDGKLDAAQFTAFEADIGQQLGAVQESVGSVTTQVAGFGTRLSGVETTLDGKLDAAQFDSFESDVQRQLDGKADAGRLSALESDVNRFESQIASFGTRLGDFQTALDRKIDAEEFRTFETDVRRELELKADVQRFGELEASMSDFNAQLATFEADVSRQLALKADGTALATLGTRIDGVQTSLNGLRTTVDRKLDATQFTAFQADIDRQLDAKADAGRLSTLESQVSTTTTQIAALQNTTSRIDRSVGSLSTSLNGLTTDMTSLRRNIDPRFR